MQAGTVFSQQLIGRESCGWESQTVFLKQTWFGLQPSMQMEGKPDQVQLGAWGTRSWNHLYLNEFGCGSLFNQSFEEGDRGRWAEAPIDSPVSALASPTPGPLHLGDRLVEHPGAELANRRMRGTRPPPPCFRPRGRRSSSPAASPSSLPAGSAAGGPRCSRLHSAPWAEVPRLLSLPGARPRFPHLLLSGVSPLYPLGKPWPTVTPFHLATSSSQPTLPSPGDIIAVSKLYHIYPRTWQGDQNNGDSS